MQASNRHCKVQTSFLLYVLYIYICIFPVVIDSLKYKQGKIKQHIHFSNCKQRSSLAQTANPQTVCKVSRQISHGTRKRTSGKRSCRHPTRPSFSLWQVELVRIGVGWRHLALKPVAHKIMSESRPPGKSKSMCPVVKSIPSEPGKIKRCIYIYTHI